MRFNEYTERAKKVINKIFVNVDPVGQRKQEFKEKVTSKERRLTEVRLDSAPCSSSANQSSNKVDELTAAPAEKEGMLSLLQQIEMRFKGVVSKMLEMTRNNGETEFKQKILEFFEQEQTWLLEKQKEAEKYRQGKMNQKDSNSEMEQPGTSQMNERDQQEAEASEDRVILLFTHVTEVLFNSQRDFYAKRIRNGANDDQNSPLI
ncbi:unnamed protein product [Cylicocyclus nassatus]|uniref:Uncharacterized protein n=1 Tax=Cylicocyclus nassatus TaxID=53992 RepID=A0AA36HGL8_CYLNA|nr:unnamed protein product [Cylicocyclus nassatus]